VAREAHDALRVAERGAQRAVELDAVRARGDRQLGAVGQALEPGGERGGVLRARVEPQADVGGDRRERVGLDEHPRSGDDHVFGGALVGGDDEDRGAQERVGALVAARGARVVGATVQVGLDAHPRSQRAHDGEALEIGGLVDVQLQEAPQASQPLRGRRDAGGVDAGGRHRVRQAHTVVVAAVEDGGIEDAGQRAAAEGRRVEARALLVGERDDRHRRVLGHRERGAHAQGAVVAPALAHAVQVRADAPPRPRRAGHRPAVAGGVDLDAQADLVRAVREPRARGLVLGRPRQPRGAALVEADGLEIGQAPRQVVGDDHEAILHAASGRTHATSPARMTRHTGLRPKR
jgi:hypothetical protein